MTDYLLYYNYIIILILIILVVIAILNMFQFSIVSNVRIIANSPMISVLVPARNEERNITQCIESLCNQEYTNYEVIVLNDSSTDKTNILLQELLSKYPDKLSIIQGDKLPIGWKGKNYACHVLSKQAKGEYLLFTDADTIHKSQSLKSLLNTSDLYKADLLSGIPLQLMNSFWELAIIPIIHLLYFAYIPNYLIRHSKDIRFTAANGQVLFFKRKIYDAIEGHESVKNDIVEDIAIARKVKQKGGVVVLANAISIISCKMYYNTKEVFEGFAKNLYPGLGYNPIVLTLFIVHFLLSYTAPLFILPFVWNSVDSIILFQVVLQLVLGLVLRLIITMAFKMSLFQAFIQPFAAFGVAIIGIMSYVWSKRSKGQLWKGRYYANNNS